jgi:hypothetical protein
MYLYSVVQQWPGKDPGEQVNNVIFVLNLVPEVNWDIFGPTSRPRIKGRTRKAQGQWSDITSRGS